MDYVFSVSQWVFHGWTLVDPHITNTKLHTVYTPVDNRKAVLHAACVCQKIERQQLFLYKHIKKLQNWTLTFPLMMVPTMYGVTNPATLPTIFKTPMTVPAQLGERSIVFDCNKTIFK